jgi:hypothetical protein
MSFGKRSPVKEAQQVAAAGPVGRGAVTIKVEAGDAAIDTMKKVVMGVGALVVLFMVYMMLPSASVSRSAQGPSAVNASTIAGVPLMSGRLNELTDANFNRIAFDFSAAEKTRSGLLTMSPVGLKVRESCLPAIKRDAPGAQPSPGDDWTQTVVGSRTDYFPWAIRTDYERGTAFLRCALIAEPARLCTEHFRKQLAEHLRFYAILHNVIVQRERKAWLAANPDQAKIVQAANGGPSPIDNVGPKFDAGIGQGVRELTAGGLLTVADFGSVEAVPRHIRPFFQAQKEDKCATLAPPPPPAPVKK